MKGRIAAMILTGAISLIAAAPAVADRVPSENASCVAYFAVPQAQSGSFGETVRTFPDIFHPLGQTVAFQAQSPRNDCPFQPPG